MSFDKMLDFHLETQYHHLSKAHCIGMIYTLFIRMSMRKFRLKCAKNLGID